MVDTYALLAETLAEAAPDGQIDLVLRPETSLAELGLDSLGTIRLEEAERQGLKQYGAVNLLKKWGAREVANVSGDVIMRW